MMRSQVQRSTVDKATRSMLHGEHAQDKNLTGAAQAERQREFLEHAKRIHAIDKSACWLSDYSLMLNQCPVCGAERS